MQWIVVRTKSIMLVSGALTCTMFYAVIAPERALRSMFGESLDGALGGIVVRNWGVLITLIGAMLVYGAFNEKARGLILTVASLGKASFIALVLMNGTRYLGQQAGLAVAADAMMVVLFAICLLASRRDVARAGAP